MINDDRKLASYELLLFLDKFFVVLSGQIEGVRHAMTNIATESMKSLLELSASADTEKEKASQILVRREGGVENGERRVGEDSYFRASSSDSASNSQNEFESKMEAIAGRSSARGQEELRLHMAKLGNLDQELQNRVMEMIGFLSADDLVSQRLEHVEQALEILKKGISGIIADFDQSMGFSQLLSLTKSLDDQLFARYTTEGEKDVHRQFLKRG